VLAEKSSDFNTTAISRKTTEARDQLVRANFEELFLSELGKFRRHNIEIDLNFSTERGRSKISQRINSYLLSDVLSEGEQKAIVLAEFLAEIQLDSSIAPVVFDDPVNSLDHHIIDDVAKRLLVLSKERQVVVFTHSILLFNSIVYYVSQPDYNRIDYKLYSSSNNYGKTGYIDEAEEEIGSIRKYLSRINMILCNTSHDVRKEADVAADGYGDLRSAIELFIEYEVLKGTVKRYQKNVALTSFVKIDGIKIDETKSRINAIFARCCGYISGHSNPTIVQNSPTIQELRKDVDDFKAIRREFNKKDITAD
jgi:energy-coupling factor transporter ATP-binding protein EcfA2